MTKKIKLLLCILYISFFVIGIRLFYLQIIKHDYYLEVIKNMNEKYVYKQMPRGKIYDTNNNLIVDNKLVKVIYFKNDYNLNTKELIELANSVKDKIELDYSKLTKSFIKDFYLLEHNIDSKIDKNIYNKYLKHEISFNEFYKLKKDKVSDSDIEIYTDSDLKKIYLFYLMTNGYSFDDKIIKNNASDMEFAYFSESNSLLKGFNTKYTYERNYLYGDTLKSVLGRVGPINSENKDYYLDKGYNLNDTVGLSYLEYMYDDYLKGLPEKYKVNGNELIKVLDGEVGNDLYLTIDINMQLMIDKILERELKNAKGSINTKYFNKSYVTVSDPNNGNILAISGKVINDNQVLNNNIGCIYDSMVSGSVVKGATILVGYNENKIKIGEHMIDECVKLKGTKEKCSIYKMGYISDLDAIRLSSNVFQFKTALRVAGLNYYYNMGASVSIEPFTLYRKYLSLFGLGSKTGIDLEKESTGIKGTNINAGLLMNLAIGQYDSYTNIELNQYIATLANGKNRYSLHFLKEIKKDDNIIKSYEPIVLNNLDSIDSKYIDRVKLALKQVMSDGTGKNYIDLTKNPSGKTGTSETFIDLNYDNIYETPTISKAFVGYFPSNNPKYAISITSPNISYVNSFSDYIYPFNKIVIRKITDNLS